MEQILKNAIQQAVKHLYNKEIDTNILQVQRTKKEFQGDFTIVVFPLLKISAKKPQETAHEIGTFIANIIPEIKNFNVIGGFLNICLSQNFWSNFLQKTYRNENYGTTEKNLNSKTIVIEFSSPNTNKPLHLGHLRNNFLGDAIAKILDCTGNNVIKVNLVNDRGIHICKSMLAWKKWANNKIPTDNNIKGDHFVGNYYVAFDKEYKKQVDHLIAQTNMDIEVAKKNAPIILEAQEMLQKWENNDPETYNLWKTMNKWVLEGFEKTYYQLGIIFDKTYYESETYMTGKELVINALQNNMLEKSPDGAIFIDLKDQQLDQKILLRADGTSVYITQDLGTAVIRYNDFNFDSHIYVVGNEQDYHFQVLKIILQKFGYNWAKNLQHFSYGMVELPEGKMKSREGKVVDADDLIDEMIQTATQKTAELGKLENMEDQKKQLTIKMIAMAALKYFILKVDPKKNMIFNPEESIDFNGNTGPFIQYANTRIKSILRNAKEKNIEYKNNLNIDFDINNKEINLLSAIYEFPNILEEAAKKYSPAIIANYIYELVKEFNQFYHEYSILNEENPDYRNFRLILIEIISRIIEKSLFLLGIQAPDKM